MLVQTLRVRRHGELMRADRGWLCRSRSACHKGVGVGFCVISKYSDGEMGEQTRARRETYVRTIHAPLHHLSIDVRWFAPRARARPVNDEGPTASSR